MSEHTSFQTTQRPPSSLSSRPHSSLSIRNPPSRPSSSASQRPPSSSSRPISSASTRPHSRYSHRPSSRHARSRLLPQCETLVSQISGLKEEGMVGDEDGENFRSAVDFAVKNLEAITLNKAAVSVDLTNVDRQISGHALKARINSRDTLAEALQKSYSQLKAIVTKDDDLDREIKLGRLPDHLQFLLTISSAPSNGTLAFATDYLDRLKNPPQPPRALTWEDILAEEPFEGEHWQGRRQERLGQHPSLSPLNSDDLALDDDDTISSIGDSQLTSQLEATLPSSENVAEKITPAYTYAYRKELESLHSKQYWRKDWQTDANPIGSLTSKYINEEDAVREVLMALQGRKNVLLEWINGRYIITSSAPKLIHLSQASQHSIVSSFACFASAIQRLRQFITSIFSQSQTKHEGREQASQTCEAFADAVDHEIRALDSWCAAREEAICRASAGLDGQALIVSLLNTEMNLRRTFATSFDVCLDIVNKVFQPSAVTTLLLDTLFSSVQEHLERADTVTSSALTRVFVRTAEPLWGMIGKWVRNGMGAGLTINQGSSNDELDDEFFIENNTGLMGMGFFIQISGKMGNGDPVSTRKVTPAFLQHVAHLILSTGKAVGLIRALGLPSQIPDLDSWRSFIKVVKSEQSDIDNRGLQDTALFSVSVDRLSKLIYDGLLPRCNSVGEVLTKVLVTECELWRHLQAVEDIFLMRRGDMMSDFIDLLFSKMDNQQSWADFHFLNTAFQDVAEANVGTNWVQASLVRLSYRNGGVRDREKTISRTVKALEGLSMEYSVPFPLTYIFRPATIHIYNDIFVFFLQVRRAKIRGKTRRENRTNDELKSFYALRSRLSWFINTLLNFFTTYQVVQGQIDKFHEELRKATSLDEMMQFHDEHLDKIQGRCLLKSNTTALHRAILSILDICLHFSEAFVAFAGDTAATHDISGSLRRRKRQRRNVVGFRNNLRKENEDDMDISAADTTEGPSFSFASSTTSTPENGYIRIDKISSELDGLVRFIRRGVESLAGGTGDASPAFGVLAFALEDWDL
ncbi:Spc98 family-domain-containing protein [Cyathus striatus]|nr:Spc98 family-domain-containing protein [Cyathus striatus]